MKSTKLVAVLAVLAFGVQSIAASTGTILLQGTVNVTADVTVTENTANNTSLNITGGGAKNVGSVLESSNNLAGYKISISSPTSGYLVHTTYATAKTAYQISYGGGALTTPVPSPGVVVKTVSSLTQLTSATAQVVADVTAFGAAPAGLYQDTLTISIQAN